MIVLGATVEVGFVPDDLSVFGRRTARVTMDAELADVDTMAASAVWMIGRHRQAADTHYSGIRVVQTGPAVFEDGQATVEFREVFPDEDPATVQAEAASSWEVLDSEGKVVETFTDQAAAEFHAQDLNDAYGPGHRVGTLPVADPGSPS